MPGGSNPRSSGVGETDLAVDILNENYEQRVGGDKMKRSVMVLTLSSFWMRAMSKRWRTRKCCESTTLYSGYLSFS